MKGCPISLLAMLLVCALPMAARAQWASRQTEHDWRLTIGGNYYGLHQTVTYTFTYGVGGFRSTDVYLGRFKTRTRIPAAYVAIIGLLPIGAAGFLFLARLLPGGSLRLQG